ncbi:MAG: DNA polymerase III subunit delta', partial [Rubrobacteraceae bacterium]|nr:DNA polymerase III subunit delta' [Rubrobacteraceae bacterium]
MAEIETFSGIRGNVATIRLLENALSTGKVAHAFIFFGAPGVGKR